VSDLQSQLDKLQRLIQLKDEQLAKLQADLAAQAKQSSEAPKAPEQPAVETPAAPAKQAATPAVQPAQTPPAEPDFNYEEPAKPDAAAAKPQQPASEPASAVKPAEKPAATKPAQPAAKPAPVVEEPQPTSLLDDLLANPMMLGIAGGGVLLLLLIGLMVVSRRNAMKEAELQSSLAGEEEESFSSDMELPDSGFEGLETIGTETTAPAPSEERVSAQTGDALGEADIYIAYGRFSQAAELLQNAINQEPQRSDLRIKLMEVQAELGDREGFARQESELREIGGSAAQIEQLKSKYPAMTAAAAVGLAGATVSDDLDSFSLDDLTLDEPVVAKPAAPAPAPAAGELDDAFELSLDDLEADLDRDVRAAATSDMTLDLDDLALDSDLDTPASASTAEPAASEDLDFDLELASEPAAEELGLGDDLADFSLDLESESAPAADEDEFMLSLDEEPAPAAMADEGLADLSLELPEEEVQAADLELPADFDLSLADEGLAEPETENFAAQLDQVSDELDQLSVDLDQPRAEPAAPAPAAAASMAGLESDDDFDFLSGTDESATKLDLARAYIDMGDTEGARDILDEVITEGNDSQQQEAREMLARLA
jgi:pilus assembly protein FimV